MIQKTTLRTAGVVLLIIANLLLLFSMLFAMYSGGRSNSGSGVGVLFVSSSEARFPEGEYRALFSGLGLESEFIGVDVSDRERIPRRIQAFSRKEKLNQIILVAYDDAAATAMHAAQTEETVAALILIMPRIDDSLEIEYAPNLLTHIFVAIFDSERTSTLLLYERLSGEDATLSKPLKVPGIFSSTIQIAPSAKTYMSLRKLFGDVVLDDMIYPGLPDVQRGVADYITKYLLSNESDPSGVRGMIFFHQMLKYIPIALLVAGLFFFLATITGAPSQRGVLPKELVRESSRPKELSLKSKIARSEKYLLALLLPVSIGYGTILSVLMIATPNYAGVFSAFWPVIAFGIAALFYVKHLRKIAAPAKANRTRFAITVMVSTLFILGVFMVMMRHVSSFRYFISFPRLLLFFIPLLGLFPSLYACQKMDMFYTEQEKSTEHRLGFLSAWRFHGTMLLPFIVMMLTSILTQKPWLFFFSLYFLLLVFFIEWFRKRIKRMSASLLLSSIMASLLYVILAFA